VSLPSSSLQRQKDPIKSSPQLRICRTYGDSTVVDFREAKKRKVQFDRDQVLLAARSTAFIFLI
jgi:hypothetical protein